MQNGGTLYGPQSEDCLTLNVWSPINASGLPVLFWIYGGSFTSGGTALTIYEGSWLAADNAVVVTVNYRLGVLGFLVNDELDANFGLRDQQLAMKWVQQNIANFGGDPTKVTLFGESAGSMSISAHLVAPSSAGLFTRVAMESGTMFQGQRGPTLVPSYNYNHILNQSATLLASLNCTSVACARALDASDLLTAQGQPGFSGWSPVVDQDFLPADPLTLLADGKILSQVDIMIGDVRDEGTMFVNMSMTAANYETVLNVSFGPTRGPMVLATYPLASFRTPGEAAAAVEGQFFFVCPSRQLLSMVPAGGNRYQWEFMHAPSWKKCQASDPGCYVAHFDEAFFVFGNPLDPLFAPFTPDEQALSDEMRKMWVSFARDGQPAVAGVWPAWEDNAQSYLTLDTTNPMTVGTKYLQKRCDFWASITPFAKL
jgi:para-nitrobenzyl esterase